MNENLDLTTILKDCPRGTKLYSTIYGDVILDSCFPICVKSEVDNQIVSVTRDGRYLFDRGECTLFPSKDQRDWSKFKVAIERFDINSLQPFDKVLVRDNVDSWKACFFSHIEGNCVFTSHGWYWHCIPYNDDTKHLVGTNKDCPEYYKWWAK